MAPKGNEDNPVRGNVEGFIEERGASDDYDEIEYLGSEYDAPDDGEDSDVNVFDKPSYGADDDDDSDNDDDSYSGQSSSSKTQESSYDDSEVGEFVVEDESHDNEEGLGSDNERVPLQQLCVLPEAQPTGTILYFAVGMKYEDKKELKRVVDEYAISRQTFVLFLSTMSSQQNHLPSRFLCLPVDDEDEAIQLPLNFKVLYFKVGLAAPDGSPRTYKESFSIKLYWIHEALV